MPPQNGVEHTMCIESNGLKGGAATLATALSDGLAPFIAESLRANLLGARAIWLNVCLNPSIDPN